MNTLIKPTPGRIVWYWPSKLDQAQPASGAPFMTWQDQNQPLPAMVFRVWHDRMVNLVVTDQAGKQHARTSVTLLQENDLPDPVNAHCQWMPYQQGQAKKAEAEASTAPLAQPSEPGASPTPACKAPGPDVVLWTSAAELLAQLSALEPGIGLRVVGDSAGSLVDISIPPVAPTADEIRARGTAAKMPACKGTNCGATDSVSHSAECVAQHEVVVNAAAAADDGIEAEIQAKGLTAPRVTPADIEANIASEHYFTAGEGVIGAFAAGEFDSHSSDVVILRRDIASTEVLKPSLNLLTFCVLVLRNGFTVVGKSACASPENFDAELGRKIARQDAVNQMWPLMGYALRERLAAAEA